MGLDMYMWKKKTESKDPKEILKLELLEEDEIGSWRKHPNLNEWFTQLYYSRLDDGSLGYTSDDFDPDDDGTFNCKNLILTKEELLQLKDIVENDKLPKGEGFFWGGNKDDYYKEYDLEVINTALKAIDEGYAIIYSCWY